MDQFTRIGKTITTGAVTAPAPDWVDLATYDIPASPNPHFISNGLCTLLEDSQIDLCGGERGWYYRRAELITASAGAERAAQFEASFDPAFEHLEIHGIRVLRGDQVIDYTERAMFEVLRRERNMERLVFDGRLSVCCTLPDIRTGDVVETSYTRYGTRKSLGGRHGAWITFEWSVGIIDVRLRMRRPKHRVIHEYGINNAPEGHETEADGICDKRWRARERPAIRYEALAPSWIVQNAAIQFSEWSNWADVIATFAPLYEESAELPADLRAEIARIEAAEPTTAGRAAAILHFVQGAVRYLAISIGEGGFTPRSLADICATRYGDCKDKAKLYVAMARQLGVEACPALVNTVDGRALDRWLPSGPVFDHCIVRVEVDGKVYWVDGTRSQQPSPLDTMSHCHFGWGLPLKPGVSALEYMPDPMPVVSVESSERITLGDSPDERVRYEWKITSRRGRAEFVREQVAREGSVGLFKSYAQDVQRTWPKAEPARQEVERDDIAANCVTMVEIYEIADAWTKLGDKLQFVTLDLVLKPALAPLDPGERKHPIYLGQIGTLKRRAEITTPSPQTSPGWDLTLECSAITFKNKLSKEAPNLLVLEQSLDIRSLTLPAEELERYRAIIADLEKSDAMILEAVTKKGVFVGSKPHRAEINRGRWTWLFGLAVIAGLAAWRYFSGGGFNFP